MSATKRYLEAIADEMGLQGEITDAVCETAERHTAVLRQYKFESYRVSCQSQEFDCEFCGAPVCIGDKAVMDFTNHAYCSIYCACEDWSDE